VLDTTTLRSTVLLVMTPSLHVAIVQHAMGYSSQGDNPAGAISIGVRVDEARPMVYRGRAVGPLEMTVARSGEGFENVCPSGIRYIVVSLPQGKAERYAADLWHEPGLLGFGPTPHQRLAFRGLEGFREVDRALQGDAGRTVGADRFE
jgi:hypothetical protein